jgi:nucleoside-diphosphate-sugar epimerase
MHVALIGYGEVGKILAEDLRAQGHAVTAFDRKLRSKSKSIGPLRTHARTHGVQLTTSPAGAVREAELIVSAVTANQTVVAAGACAISRPRSHRLSQSRSVRSLSRSLPRRRRLRPLLRQPSNKHAPSAAPATHSRRPTSFRGRCGVMNSNG